MKVKSALLGLAAASGGLLSASVASADGYSAPARYVPAPTWTGCYVGIQGGWSWGESKHKEQVVNNLVQTTGNTGTIGTPTIALTAPGQPTITTAAPTSVRTNTIASFDMDGGLIGGTFGCNLQSSGGFVLGVESDASWIDKRGSAHDTNGYNPVFVSSTREHYLATTRLRLGWAAGNFLLYATGGAAFSDVEAAVNSNGALGSISQDKWRIGLVYGGGAEWKFDRHWSAKLEYLHVDFENQQYFTPPPTGFASRNGGVTLNDDIVRVGINYSFGRREAVPLK